MKKLPCGRPIPAHDDHPGEDGPDPDQLFAKLRDQLTAFVDAKGLNRSEARVKILETIVREARHFRAQDLLGRLQKRHPEVGKATLYRNLPILVESGLIQEGPMDSQGQALYELAEHEHHDHIVCIDCRKIFEFHDETIEKRQTQIAKGMKFDLKRHHHVIYAECEYLAGKKA
jgi:Fur family ferric uptake transcriptional regulator